MADDIYSLYMAENEPTAAEMAAAYARALRGQRGIGNVGLLSGDRVLGAFGKSQVDGAAKQEELLADAGKHRSQHGLQQALAKIRRQQEISDKASGNREWDRRNAITAAQEAENARIAAGQRADAAQRGTVVPGLEVAPGAAPTPEDAKKVKAAVAARERMNAYARELRDLHGGNPAKGIEAHGTEWGGEIGNRMQALTTQMRLEGKSLADLGALSGPDMDLMRSIVRADPGGFWSNAKAMMGVDNTQGALDDIGKWTDDQYEAAKKAYGYQSPASGPIRVRDPKTGRTGKWRGPGEPPPDLEVLP